MSEQEATPQVETPDTVETTEPQKECDGSCSCEGGVCTKEEPDIESAVEERIDQVFSTLADMRKNLYETLKPMMGALSELPNRKDIVKVLAQMFNMITLHDEIVRGVFTDMVIMARQISASQNELIKLSVSVAATQSNLIKKELITQEDIEQTFTEIMEEAAQEQLAEMKAAVEKAKQAQEEEKKE